MNVGLVTPYYPDNESSNSGIANHFYLLAEALNNLGHKVIVIHIRPIRNNENIEEEVFEQNGITCIVCKISLHRWIESMFGDRWAIKDFCQKLLAIIKTNNKLKRIIKLFDLQIIETSSYFSLCYLYLFRINTIPVVTRISTTYKQMTTDYYPYKSRLGNIIAKLEYLMIKKSNHIITHSSNHLEEIKRIFNFDIKNCEIIPHGITLPFFNKKEQTSSVINILFVGRMESRKGIDILLESIPIVLKDSVNINFNLAGDNYKEYQIDFQKKHASLNNVSFLGKVDPVKLDTLYSECNIFVAPSRYESFGLIYIEAMSYGKPVIGCRVGGVIDIINDDIDGIFSELNPVDLASKILMLAKDQKLRESISKFARYKVEGKYTKEIMAKNSVNYYNRILSIRN